ncbi:hypothetical protein IQ268_16035 [Oculatella sp. LEGE 06141]|uniref:hypothetical protein n=1 Tax=Oculatella sp. LEGE 06141 TaxID=1828648 RepID=UPI0018827D45|nr:hypothetical protein [Oculatella sp. LEGE 06141]MBE9180081.1 hypothetical protein [Oculatella sp. LEGE 06141]
MHSASLQLTMPTVDGLMTLLKCNLCLHWLRLADGTGQGAKFDDARALAVRSDNPGADCYPNAKTMRSYGPPGILDSLMTVL